MEVEHIMPELKECFAIEIYNRNGKRVRVRRGHTTYPTDEQILYALTTSLINQNFESKEARYEYIRENLCARVSKYYMLK